MREDWVLTPSPTPLTHAVARAAPRPRDTLTPARPFASADFATCSRNELLHKKQASPTERQRHWGNQPALRRLLSRRRLVRPRRRPPRRLSRHVAARAPRRVDLGARRAHPPAGERGAVHRRPQRRAQRRGQRRHLKGVSRIKKGLGDRGEGQEGGGGEAKGRGAPAREEGRKRRRGKRCETVVVAVVVTSVAASVASSSSSPSPRRGHEPDQRVQQHRTGKVEGVGEQLEQAQGEPARAVDPPDAPGE